MPLDPLQSSPLGPWPDLECDAPVGWLPAGSAPPPVVVVPPPTDTPPPWQPSAATAFVREVQRLVPAAGPMTQAGRRSPIRTDFKTYQPFGNR